MKARAGRLREHGLLCRVLTPTTINGQARAAGDTVELTEPQRGFLIAHRIVALVAIVPTVELGKRGDHGPAV